MTSLEAAADDGQQVADVARGPEERVAGRELERALAAAIAALPLGLNAVWCAATSLCKHS